MALFDAGASSGPSLNCLGVAELFRLVDAFLPLRLICFSYFSCTSVFAFLCPYHESNYFSLPLKVFTNLNDSLSKEKDYVIFIYVQGENKAFVLCKTNFERITLGENKGGNEEEIHKMLYLIELCTEIDGLT